MFWPVYMIRKETFFKRRRQINPIVFLLTNNSSGSFKKDLEKDIAGWYRLVLFGRLGRPFPRKRVFIFLTQKNEITSITSLYMKIWKRKFYESIYDCKMQIENYDLKMCCKNNQTSNCKSCLLIFCDIFFIGLLNWCNISWYMWEFNFS